MGYPVECACHSWQLFYHRAPPYTFYLFTLSPPFATLGVLVLVPNHPMFNLLVTSFVFVCAAHEINSVTGVLVNYFVPPSNSRKMARNLAIFAVVMIVLAVNDGMI